MIQRIEITYQIADTRAKVRKKKIESFSGLLYRLARNCVIDLYRSKSKQKEQTN